MRGEISGSSENLEISEDAKPLGDQILRNVQLSLRKIFAENVQQIQKQKPVPVSIPSVTQVKFCHKLLHV